MTEAYVFELTCPAAFNASMKSSPAAGWTYQRTTTPYAVDTAYWNAPAAPDGKLHFHDETQLVFVISGRREFIVQSRSYAVEAGQCLLIPAGKLHRSIPISNTPTQCLNLYVPESRVASLCEALRIRPAAEAESRDLSDLVRRALAALSDPAGQLYDVSALAATYGYSREGFTRKFSKETGVGPAEFSLLVRLNHARALLRNGCPAALAAFECGFTDQSHMGRHFVKTFGTSPVQYARA
ncbi:helix-turn-helix domain-containing protein [Burkholderia sp. AU39826]|uniref:helix-turn-helix domain-containing protein n=1 Tax=Burkholderia sp. AU39826 TaxID=2879634 RepID=UPI001CF1D142|nr:helix-turn-helix domain-containing protein [Burkholderia sp. AU39826]MCA7969193.1 helix-turn-helix domain-containing protein [Burkholderia sp. AU39826]